MLRKIAEIKVPKGAGPREVKTKHIFATYDRQGSAFAFYFSDSNIVGAMANLLFMIDGQKVFVDDGVTLSETNETHTFTYPLPDKLLNYTGKVDGYLYFDFEDGSHSDEIHFVFTIKKSQIDKTMEEVPDIYIKSFEDVKAEVQEAADGAKETISQNVTEVSDTSDSAISKVNQVADDTIKTADQAQGDIQTSVSDVQSRQAGAEKDIAGLVESTESARDEAVKTMTELDYSDRNLLPGTSDEWETYEWDTSYGWQGAVYSLEELGLKVGDTITFSKLLDNTLDDVDLQVWAEIFFRDVNGERLSSMRPSSIESGQRGYVKGTEKIPEKTHYLYIFKANKGNNQVAKVVAGKETKLQHGTRATSWTPAPEDIVLKSDITENKPLELTFENNTFWDTKTSVAVKNTFTGYYRTTEIETYEGQEFLISIQMGESDKQEAIVVADNDYNILWKIYDVNGLTKLDNYALTIPASGTKLLLTDYSLDSNIEVKTDVYSGIASKSYLDSKLADIGFNNEFAGESFSVLGDSTSAYIGHIPDGNAHYYNGSNSGVSDASEMWWSVLAENTGMTPLIIDAWSGSKVSSIDVEGKGFVPASDISRAQNLHDDTNNPDNIFIKMAINDFTKTGAAIGTWDGGSTLPADNGDFSSAYALMLSRVREAYPNTRIFCLSLGIFIRTNTDKNGVEYNDEGKTIHDYNEVIRKMCDLFGAAYIDTQNIGITRQNIYPTYAEDYSSIPTHYNAVGHLVLGESVAKKIMQP